MTKKLFDAQAITEIGKKKESWQKRCYKPQEEHPIEFKTLSGIPVQPLYTASDVENMSYMKDLGFPGEEPFLRGVHPTMYRGRTWTQRQLAGFGPPEETNKRYKYLLEMGATGINGVFDYPTLRGYDSTDPEARADAGRGGVSIDTIEDMRILFDGIPIEKISTSMVTCQPICNIIIQSMYFANAKARGIPLDTLAGTNQNDFMMETAIAIAPGVLPPEASFKLSCDGIEYCTKYATRWNPISFAGYNYREAGCTAIQEAAFTMANAIACSEEMILRGYDIDSFAPRLSFFFSAHSDFFEEIAKYRAARRLWGKIMKSRFKAKNPRSLMLRFHVQTAGVSLTAQQPLNNIARVAYQALSAVLGGAQSIHADGYDEALCCPTELSSVTALRTQQILQHETRVTHTVDPVGGSYFLESLTNELENRMAALIEKIDQNGGIIEAVKKGWIHKEIADSAYAFQHTVESGEQLIVGVNSFQMEDEVLPVGLFEVPETIAIQEKKLKMIKKKRSTTAVQKALDEISRSCEQGDNMMEKIVQAVPAYLTEGEIAKVLKKCYGIWNPPLF